MKYKIVTKEHKGVEARFVENESGEKFAQIIDIEVSSGVPHAFLVKPIEFAADEVIEASGENEEEVLNDLLERVTERYGLE